MATDQGGGSVKLWVITLGGSLEQDSTQQIDIVLKPPQPGGSRKVSSGSVVKDLETAIMSVAEGVRKAGEEPNPLTLASFDVQITFAIKATANGAGIIEILPLGPSLSGSVSKTATQTLTVSFAAPLPK